MNGAPLLEIRDLRVAFRMGACEALAVHGISFSMQPGEALGLVGESGCGKSVTALSILRLVPRPPGRILDGSSIRLRSEELLDASPERMREVRGGEIGIVFQEPMTSLNPVLRIGDQVAEAVAAHSRLDRAMVRRRVDDLLGSVGLTDTAALARAWPHQLSGGMRQRVLIAIALAADPVLLIADEATSALDATVQASILDLLDRLRREREMALLLISHDLAVASRMTDRIAVMYGGKILEEGDTTALLTHPAHPYTLGLLGSIPDPERTGMRLEAIPGSVHDIRARPEGCSFHPRCDRAFGRCTEEIPPLLPGPATRAACWLLEDEP